MQVFQPEAHRQQSCPSHPTPLTPSPAWLALTGSAATPAPPCATPTTPPEAPSACHVTQAHPWQKAHPSSTPGADPATALLDARITSWPFPEGVTRLEAIHPLQASTCTAITHTLP
jgi:hypothetical protein